MGEDDFHDHTDDCTDIHEEFVISSGESIMDIFIISKDNKIYLIWRAIVIFSCLTSSYFYAYMAAFENP